MHRRRSSLLLTTGATSRMHLESMTTSPVSQRVLTWQSCGAVLIVADLVFVPLQVFDLPLDTLRDVSNWISSAYWTVDVVLSFFVGYYVDGILEMRFKKIALRYLRTWFLLDMVLVVCEWVMFMIGVSQASSDSGVVTYWKAARWLRFLRFMRLLRLLKVQNFSSKIVEQITSEHVLTMLQVQLVWSGNDLRPEHVGDQAF